MVSDTQRPVGERYKINEIDRERFYQIPVALMTDEYYRQISANAKLMYAVLKDRMELSRKNGWEDDNGDLFLYFTHEALEGVMAMSNSTVKRTMKELQDIGLIESIRQGLNKPNKIYIRKMADVVTYPNRSNMTPELDLYSNTNKSNSNSNNMSGTPDLVARVISYLNRKAGVAYKPNTQATIRLIHAREKEGFKAEDFKAVIDNMCREWKNDPKMKKYLRPATLFAASKFEGYLNMGRKVVTSPSDGLSQEERKKRKEQELAEMTERLKAEKEKEELAKQEQERKRQEYLNSPEYKRMKAKGEAFMKKLIGGE